MNPSCLLADCIWSDQVAFCTTLKQAAVPLDQKWPLVILYLRGIKQNTMFSEQQKGEMQNLLLELLQKKDFSEAALEETEQRVHSIITASYAEKIQEIANEASELAKDMHSILGKHHEDVSAIATKVDVGMAEGFDPKEVLTDLRSALKDVMAKMAEDASSLMTLSRQDSLTGLANRRRFDEFLHEAAQMWAESRTPISLIMMDIDHFKKVNDTFGHPVGDQVLQALAGQVKKILKPLVDGGTNILAARYGGEEFAIVVCGEPVACAVVLAEIIRKAASKIAVVLPGGENGGENGGEGGKLTLTVSLGVASMWDGWKGAGEKNLVDFADKALYQAKSSGRNCTVQYLSESAGRYEIVSS